MAEIKYKITFPVYLSVTTLADWTAPAVEKCYLIDYAVELYDNPPMKSVGVSIVALL